jgi:GTP-binding protein
VDTAFAAAMAKLSTPKLTRALQAIDRAAAAAHGGRFRPKLRYAHQGGSNPPIVVIHGSGPTGSRPLPRYLENTFRNTFKLQGHALRSRAAARQNPSRASVKPLTEKQDAQRRRRKIVSKRRYG